MNNFEPRAMFGRSIKDLARSGERPLVLFDCLKFLSSRGLSDPDLFSGVINKKKLLQLKHMYENGRRPLKGNSAAKVAACDAANLLMLWLGSLPEPLLPVEHAAMLVDQGGEQPSFDNIKQILLQTEPFIIEAIYPLFEMIHHYYLNQRGTEGSLQYLASLFSTPVFGTEQEHGLYGPKWAASIQGACAMMITHYRPLFTHPCTLNRYEKDSQNTKPSVSIKVVCGDSSPSLNNVHEQDEDTELHGLIHETIQSMLSSWEDTSGVQRCKEFELDLERVYSPTSVIMSPHGRM